MGLDNMPMKYPCEDIAIKDSDGRIECKKTQESGKCPYLNEYSRDPMVNKTIPVRGMIGLDCWYRGKYGNYLLSKMKEHNNEFPYGEDGFYGDTEEGISEDICITMSETMVDFTEAWSKVVHDMINNGEIIEERKEELIKDWIYAAWWLKFVGNYGDGSAIWY